MTPPELSITGAGPGQGTMLGDALPDLAVRGEGGIDVFDRLDQPDHRRSRFRCLGRVVTGPDGADRAEAFETAGKQDPGRLMRAAAALQGQDAALDPAFRLSAATGFPRAQGGAAALLLFLRIDFLRAWTLADQGLQRYLQALGTDPARATERPGETAAQVALAYDFNRIGAGVTLARAILPALPRPDLCADGHAYALRMLGDLALRGAEAALALDCFEGAIAIGDNPHRRARALAAATALGDAEAIARHRPKAPA